jgi:hypothetical protein
MSIAEGWYPDPDGKPCERYWDGFNWTGQTRPLTKTPSADKVEQPKIIIKKGGGCGKAILWTLIIFVGLFIFSCISILGDDSSSDSGSTGSSSSSTIQNSAPSNSTPKNLSEVEQLTLEVDWQNYSPNVKTNLFSLYEASDCGGLQSQFDISYQNDDAQRNRVGSGNADLLNLTDAMMREIGCY